MGRGCLQAVVAAVLALALTAPAAAQNGSELSPSEDNGGQGTCGTPCFEPDKEVPPAEACDDKRSTAGSLIERRLPRGPRRSDGSLAFVSGACVYLPPGYEQSGLRYPVVYLLHGGGGDQADWVVKGEAQRILDEAYARSAANAAIVVMPDGSSDASWFDRLDGASLNEQYVLRWLIPFVDARYRTIADRRGRAIVGLSNGGHGATYLTAAAPDLFGATAGMSSNIGWQSFTGGAELDKSEAPAWFNGHLPRELAVNYDGIDLMLDIGTSCSSDLTQDACGGFAFEQLFVQDNRDFVARMGSDAHAGGLDYRETEGGHAWRWWQKWLSERQLPFLLARIDDPEPADSPAVRSPPRLPFRYRSVQDGFSVYGYDVRVERRARELLELRGVSRRGMTIKGSGRAHVVTAPLYRFGARYLVAGEGDGIRLTRAGRAGRIALNADLGPPHEHEQFTEEQQSEEAEGNYWTERAVTLERLVQRRCGDRRRPRGWLAGGASRITGSEFELSGGARDRGCSGLARVLVSVARQEGGRCSFLRPDGRLGAARSCRSRRYLQATGGRAWSTGGSANLPSGRYRIEVRALDRQGNLGAVRRTRRTIG